MYEKNPKIVPNPSFKDAFNSSGSPDATAWPHQARKHILQLATVTLPSAILANEVVLKLLENAPSDSTNSRRRRLWAKFLGRL